MGRYHISAISAKGLVGRLGVERLQHHVTSYGHGLLWIREPTFVRRFSRKLWFSSSAGLSLHLVLNLGSSQ